MASESSGERTVSITLPADLDEWLDEQAATADTDREQLLVQLLAAYRTTAQENGHSEDPILEIEDGDVAEIVSQQLDEELSARLTDEIGETLDEEVQNRIETAVQEIVTDQISEATTSVQRQLTDQIETVESEFDEKITDVRQRVIQVKKEADAKAPADHSHPELQQVETLERRLSTLETELKELETEFEELVPDHNDQISDVSGRVRQMQERLQTLAWVVSDLREAHESTTGLETVERIKRAAAKADIQRANCENCGEGVTLSLLTDPECPHCNATVTNVEPSGGWFSKPKLLTAAQLESGEQR